jgi:hypothetical protein
MNVILGTRRLRCEGFMGGDIRGGLGCPLVPISTEGQRKTEENAIPGAIDYQK